MIRTHSRFGRLVRWTRSLAIIALSVAGGLVLLVVTLLAVLRLPPVRAFAVRQANAALRGVFRGELRIEQVARIGLFGASGVQGSVFDAAGHRVLNVCGGTVQVAVLPLVWGILAHPGAPLSIDLGRVTANHVELRLVDDGHSSPTLFSAFDTPQPVDGVSKSPPLTVRLRQIEVYHAWIHGRLGTAPAVDAEIGQAVGRLVVVADILSLQVDRTALLGRGLPYAVDPYGELGGTLELAIGESSSIGNGTGKNTNAGRLVVHAWYKGTLAGSQTAANFDWAKDKLFASLDIPHLEPASVARVVPRLRIRDGLALKATAEGPFSDLQFEARVLANNKTAEATELLRVVGHGNAAESPELDAELRAENLNMATLLVDVPESKAGVVLQVQITQPNRGAITGRYDWSSSTGQISGTPIPAVHCLGTIRQAPNGAIEGNGRATILEPGAHTTLNFSAILSSKAAESVVSVDSVTQLAEPERLFAIASGLRAQGSVEASARYWLDDGHWTARSHAKLHDVRHGQFRASELDVRADAAAQDGAPSGFVHLQAREVDAAGQSFRHLVLDAAGTLERAHVTATGERDDAQRFELTTELGLKPTLSMESARLLLPAREGAIAISVQNVHSRGGKFHVDRLHLDGAGTADASLLFGSELEQLVLKAVSLDLARLAPILGIHSPVQSGRLTLVARYLHPGPAAEGLIQGRISELKIGTMEVGSGEVDLTLARSKIDATLTAQFAPNGSARIAVRALPLSMLGHPELVLGSRDFSVSGRVALDLSRLRPWLQALSLPLDNASGTILVDVTARGPRDGDEQSDVSARLETHALELSGLSDKQPDVQDVAKVWKARPWSLQGVDGELALSISGRSPRAELSTRLFDRRGTLLVGHASADLPPSVWPGLHFDAVEAQHLRLIGTLHIPRRPLQQFPAIVRIEGLRGVASLDVAIEGTIKDPKLVVDGTIEGLSNRVGRIAGKQRLKLDANFHADGSRQRGRIRVEVNQQKRAIGNLEAIWKGDAGRLMTETLNGPSPLQGDLVARFGGFPLEALPAIRTRQFSGLVSGELALRNWGQDATFVAKLEVLQLGLGNVVVEQASLDVDSSNGQLGAEVRISGSRSGVLEANVKTKMSWGNQVIPSIDPALHGELVARGFQLGVLTPLLSDTFNELEGSTDAKLSITLDKGVPRVEGQAILSQGVVQIPSIGQRFESIGARVTIHEGNLSIRDMQASGLTGSATGSASAQLDGLSPTSGEAHIAIARGEQIPVTIEGQAVGEAWGRVDLTFERSSAAKTTKFRIALPELHLELPDLDPTNLQDLGPAEHLRIGVHRSDGRFESLPVQPLKMVSQHEREALDVEVHLGKSVWIRKGATVKVQLGGDLLARIAEKTTLEGRLELKGGTLDVSGKTFAIENGLVIFDGGDSGNPEVNATALWDSAAEYRVYAQYTGTVKDGTLKLRSEPPLSPDKIVSLLMFGTPDGTFRTSSEQGQKGSSTATAIGVAGDSAVKGLNRALAGMTKLDVSARLDTSTGTARPELNVQLTPRVIARMTRAIGEPTFGQSPDRTFLTLELHLRQSWALSAVVGDRGGSALDFLWRRRY